MNYVNLLGESVATDTPAQKKKKSKREFKPTHSGWVVKGADPREWRKAMEGKAENEIQEWYDWARHNNNKKVVNKPFSSAETANECKKVAESQGWRNVHVVELKRGDVSQLKGVYV